MPVGTYKHKPMSEKGRKNISDGKKKEKNPNWKGNKITPAGGRYRARSWFPLKPCEICGNTKSEIHHKDRNPLNNNPDNIQFLCRKHHMAIDKREIKSQFKKGNIPWNKRQK